MEEIKCQQVGQIVGQGFNDMTGRVYKTEGLCPTIRIMAGGNTELKIAEETQPITTKETQQAVVEPIAYDEQNGYLRQDGCVGTLTTDGSSPKHNNRIVEPNYRIRKLTGRECFRLMGVKDEDFERAAKNQSASSLYHLAGDSIVTACLMAIFGKLLGVDYEQKITELTEELKEKL